MDSKRRSRNFCFTNFNLELDIIALTGARAGGVGLEICPTTDREHQQGWLCFKEARTVSAVVKSTIMYKSVHWSHMNGTIQDSIKYCSKDGKYEEFGVIPLSQAEKGKKEKIRWDVALALAKEGRIEEIDSDIQFRYQSTCHAIATRYAKRPLPLSDVCGVWIYGESGVGKSRYALEKYPNHYIKSRNKWWQSYQGQDVAVCDDVGHDDIKWMVPFLLDWADFKPFQAEYKGGSMMIRPQVFVVTSQWSIDELTDLSDQSRTALRRRFKNLKVVASMFKKKDVIEERIN